MADEINTAAPAEITLGERRLPIQAIPLGQLRKLLPMFVRVGRAFTLATIDEAALADLVEIISRATSVPVEQLDAMPCTYPQLLAALEAITRVCGLEAKGGGLGEVRPGAAALPPG